MQQLGTAEIKFRKSLHPAVEKVVHKKQFLVLLEMLQDLGFPKYRTLVPLTGFPLVGQLEETHIVRKTGTSMHHSEGAQYKKRSLAVQTP